MVDTQYTKSCTEVLEILKHISKQDYNKIPSEVIEALEEDKDSQYNFSYDVNKTLDEQNVSKQAKTIIGIFFRDYWATPEQRKNIINIQNIKRQEIDDEKRKLYNPDKIFENKASKDSIHNNTSLIEVKKETNFIQKLIAKLKSLFKR